jgi:agmatine deiminase
MIRMPAEWEKHSRTWVAFPPAGYLLGETKGEAEVAYRAWSAVANAASEFEPVSVVVNPGDLAVAKKYLSSAVELVEIPINDAWIRDSGPSFVVDGGELKAINWVFNGWGAQEWTRFDLDAQLATAVAEHAGVEVIDSPMVNEGGGFHVDGSGRVLLTKTVQLGKGRNPSLSRADVEAELSRTLGVEKFHWLERGLTRDYETFGTQGHVDIVACFAPDGRILYHDQRNPNHPDYPVSQEVRRSFEQAGFDLVAVPAPEVLTDGLGPVDYSYINHYVLNDAVLLCSFDDPQDTEARAILRDVYPGREILLLDATEIFARGGGIHCITQQQPAI